MRYLPLLPWPATLLTMACAVAPAIEEPPRPEATATSTASGPAVSASPVAGAQTEAQSSIPGRWFVDSVGSLAFPAPDTGLRAFVDFDASGFLSHAASCGGGYPAFYTLDGEQIAITRREAVIYGKCDSPAGEQREQALTAALDGAERWELAGDTLLLTSRDGTVTRLSRPTEPIPALGGSWVVLTIGGQPLGSDRPAIVELSRGFMGAAADCNSLSTEYSADARGAFRVTGDLVATQMRCADADMAEDSRLFGALGGVTGWAVGSDGRLTLSGPQTLVLRRP